MNTNDTKAVLIDASHSCTIVEFDGTEKAFSGVYVRIPFITQLALVAEPNVGLYPQIYFNIAASLPEGEHEFIDEPGSEVHAFYNTWEGQYRIKKGIVNIIRTENNYLLSGGFYLETYGGHIIKDGSFTIYYDA